MPDFPSDPLSDRAEALLERIGDPRYRFHGDETAAAGVHRIAMGRIDSAVAHLQPDAGDDVAEAVHETRKDLKKLRSLLRLVRKPVGGKAFRRENDRYRDAARKLGQARDAQVRLDTVAALRERYGDEMPATPDLEARLTARRDSAAEPRDAIEQARAEIAAGAAALDDLALDEEAGFELIAAGLERSYRRGRRLMRKVRKQPGDERVHEWRKRVKDLWYHLRLVSDAWEDGLKGPEHAAHDLSDLLGDHHDLTVLAEALGNTPEERDLRPVIEARQAELLAEALPLGRVLYAEKPKRFVSRVGRYWRTWPAGS